MPAMALALISRSYFFKTSEGFILLFDSHRHEKSRLSVPSQRRLQNRQYTLLWETKNVPAKSKN